MSDHSIYLRVSGVYIHEITQGADPLPMCNAEGSSMVPSVTSVHVTPLHFSSAYLSLATTFLWRLPLSGIYISLAPTFL
jgi:hypothetical protein